MEENKNKTQVVITKSTKSMGIALLLTALFGPLGMFYSTIIGAIVMFAIYIGFSIITFGFGLAFLFLLNPLCMIWAAIAANSYNKKLMAEVNS